MEMYRIQEKINIIIIIIITKKLETNFVKSKDVLTVF